jgi:small neutral amino acid transporter SnatA (MarC family)
MGVQVHVAISILIILVVSAFIGLDVLSVFGISLDVFRIVGGIIIVYMGFGMLGGGQNIAQTPPALEANTDARNSLALLVMFAAGPGTITAVVTWRPSTRQMVCRCLHWRLRWSAPA